MDLRCNKTFVLGACQVVSNNVVSYHHLVDDKDSTKVLIYQENNVTKKFIEDPK